jgi:hypothetical protein
VAEVQGGQQTKRVKLGVEIGFLVFFSMLALVATWNVLEMWYG